MKNTHAFADGRAAGVSDGMSGVRRAPMPSITIIQYDRDYEIDYIKGYELGYVVGQRQHQMMERGVEQDLDDRER